MAILATLFAVIGSRRARADDGSGWVSTLLSEAPPPPDSSVIAQIRESFIASLM